MRIGAAGAEFVATPPKPNKSVDPAGKEILL
jgi:hypothetical protein